MKHMVLDALWDHSLPLPNFGQATWVPCPLILLHVSELMGKERCFFLSKNIQLIIESDFHIYSTIDHQKIH